MEGGAAGDPRGLWGNPPAGTGLVPRRLRTVGSPPGAAPLSRPPVLILQQLPGPGAAPAGPPPVRGADLMELMLIQSSQMHQLLMHGLAMAALMPLSVGPVPVPAQVLPGPPQGEEEEEAVVFHHHYIPWPGPRPVRFLRSPPGPGGAVPPPPPPSATGTVGPSVLPAAGYYSAEERGLGAVPADPSVPDGHSAIPTVSGCFPGCQRPRAGVSQRCHSP
ncbi:proline-rich protein 29 isoform X2 [Poecile atricapillus]|uniref:proline-rich protein 29 isoform X2 n=1 Tax=Poecile atricapillus TaxID=48891 RepID=UPI00273A49A5|nr:proline-rich protein 29 isoform X2 [Poecile atricapillus]